MAKHRYVQEEFIRTATTFANRDYVVRNTVIYVSPGTLYSGQLDGMAECVYLKEAGEASGWLHFRWSGYNAKQ